MTNTHLDNNDFYFYIKHYLHVNLYKSYNFTIIIDQIVLLKAHS